MPKTSTADYIPLAATSNGANDAGMRSWSAGREAKYVYNSATSSFLLTDEKSMSLPAGASARAEAILSVTSYSAKAC